MGCPAAGTVYRTAPITKQGSTQPVRSINPVRTEFLLTNSPVTVAVIHYVAGLKRSGQNFLQGIYKTPFDIPALIFGNLTFAITKLKQNAYRRETQKGKH
jgi:anaerobic C4-dicarboxylate transporter